MTLDYNPFPWMDEPDPLHGEIDAMFKRTDDAFDYVDVALDDAALRELPPPRELIPGWVPLVGVAGIWAPPGYMKTFILTGMAKAVRRGKRWQHRHEPVRRRGGVLFFEGEIPQQLAERQDAFDLRYPLLRGRESPQWTIPSTPDLTTVAGVAATIRTAEAFKAKLLAEGDDLAMVVFDPLPEYFTGEEAGDGLVRAVRALCWIAERLQCSVVVGHQSNAGGERARGHDIFRQKVFVLAHIERPEPGGLNWPSQHLDRGGARCERCVSGSGRSRSIEDRSRLRDGQRSRGEKTACGSGRRSLAG